MPMKRRHFQRIVLWQECVGNVLDLPSRFCLASSGPDVQEDRTATTAGTERATSRSHVIEIPLSEEETARLANIMEELSDLYGHRVGATLLGSSGAGHIHWAQPTSLQVTPESRDFFGRAASTLRLQTAVFHAAVGEGESLIEPIPWEGTSTVGALGKAYGITAYESNIAITDPDAGRIWIYSAWDGESLRYIPLQSTVTPGIHYLKSLNEFVVTDGANDLVRRIDPADGTEFTTFTPEDASGSAVTSPVSCTVANGDFVLADQGHNIHIYDGLDISGTPTATTTFSVSSDLGRSVAFDGADLYTIGGPAGSAQTLYQLDGTSSTIVSQTTLASNSRGISFQQGLLEQQIDGKLKKYSDGGSTLVGTADLSAPQPLRIRGSDGRSERGYYGPLWRARHETEVDITGTPSVVSSSDPILLTFPFPLGGSEVRLQGVTGSLDGEDFGGTALTISDSSRIGSPPQILLEGGKYSGLDINASSTWALRSRIESVTDRPEMVVVDTGTPRGPLRGGHSESCVTSPQWAAAAVSAIAFDVDADAGDQLSISVTQAPGTDSYAGQISGEGEAINGTSAKFNYEDAGTFTPEMVGQPDFEGVTGLSVGGRFEANVISEIQEFGLGKLSDIETLDLGRNNLQGTIDATSFPGGITTLILLENKNINGDLTANTLNPDCEIFELKAWGINNSPNPKVQLGDFQSMVRFQGKFGDAKDRGSFSNISPVLEYANGLRNITGSPADAPQGTKDSLREYRRGTTNNYPITDWYGYSVIEFLNTDEVEGNSVVADLDTTSSGTPSLVAVNAPLSGALENLPPGIEISKVGDSNPSNNPFDINNHPNLQTIARAPNFMSCSGFERFIQNLYDNKSELPGGSGSGSLSLARVNANKATVSDQAYNQIQEIQSDTDLSISLRNAKRVSTC